MSSQYFFIIEGHTYGSLPEPTILLSQYLMHTSFQTGFPTTYPFTTKGECCSSTPLCQVIVLYKEGIQELHSPLLKCRALK